MPVLAPFQLPLARAFSPFGAVSSGAAIQSLLNAQKLSLPANTPVGTRVQVTDGFVVSGLPNPQLNAAYLPSAREFPLLGISGGTHGGRDYYSTPDGYGICFWDDGGLYWVIDKFDDSYAVNGITNDTEPWESVNWTDGSGPVAVTLTHPAVQELTAPSTAQGGVFVSGGTQDGIHARLTDPVNGKAAYLGLGLDPNNISYTVTYSSSFITDFTAENDGTGWAIISNVGIFTYYSLSNVATPDLATNWKNASDDSPASITVTSVTQGELDAGVLVAGAGSSAANGVGVGPTRYVDGEDPGTYGIGNLTGDTVRAYFGGSAWVIGNPNNFVNYGSAQKKAFPWQITDLAADTGTPPAPTVTRDDVASEPNWNNV